MNYYLLYDGGIVDGRYFLPRLARGVPRGGDSALGRVKCLKNLPPHGPALQPYTLKTTHSTPSNRSGPQLGQF